MNLWLVNMDVRIRLKADSNVRTSYKLLKILVFAKMPRLDQLENSLKPVDIFTWNKTLLLYVNDLFIEDI
ncbi:MAG TPA: hypothetical protein VK484_01655 [Ferruginibacter sp.]|nr:hypothetical protein [Ferruginibacter sp.]